MTKKFACFALSAALAFSLGCEDTGYQDEPGLEPTGDVTHEHLEDAEPLVVPEGPVGDAEPADTEPQDTQPADTEAPEVVEQVPADDTAGAEGAAETGEPVETVVDDATLEDLQPEATEEAETGAETDAVEEVEPQE